VTNTISTVEDGTPFSRALDADWAATLDSLKVRWTYEQGVFHLSDQNVWAAVGTPDVALPSGDRDDVRDPMSIHLLAPDPDGMATWAGANPAQDLILTHCPACDGHTFMDVNGAWQCRICHHGGRGNDNKFWRKEHYRPGELLFIRATALGERP